MWNGETNFPARGFSTPPATWKTRCSRSVKTPMSEQRISSPVASHGDLFHVIHKVPAGDSPYVKAKHVQLIEKDPTRAVSLFWGAINAGDRVDSALKDMAIVLKQLNRSDEAIEAIKSFRHLCPYDSQESIDNVLIELYKRSGRVDEEIEMLQCKLKQIEDGTAFGGRRTKTARSQGKKVQVTVDQERSRILGNLAWAHLQQGNYRIAEEHYRKALALEPDRNKQCNLAICLMQTNRIAEAKSVLQAVRASAGGKSMDESYAKSFERAFKMLTEIECQLLSSKSAKIEEQGCRQIERALILMSPISRNSNEVDRASDGGQQHISALSVPTRWINGHDEKKKHKGTADDELGFKIGVGTGSANENVFSSPAAVRRNLEAPLTQPRRSPWGFNNKNQRRELHDYTASNSTRKLSFEQENFDGNLVAAAAHELSELHIDSTCKTMYSSPAAAAASKNHHEVPFTQPRRYSRFGGRFQRRESWENKNAGSLNRKLSFENVRRRVDPNSCRLEFSKAVIDPVFKPNSGGVWKHNAWQDYRHGDSAETSNGSCHITGNPNSNNCKKSWADMVEEEEEELELFPGKSLGDWGGEEEENNDENLNINALNQGRYNRSGDSFSSRNLSVRRSLCFDRQEKHEDIDNFCSPLSLTESSVKGNGKDSSSGEKVRLTRRNRLQVFRDITVHHGSP